MRPVIILLGAALSAAPGHLPTAETPAPTPAQQEQAPLLPAAELATIDALIGRAIAAGFPEVRGAGIVLGKVVVTEASEPDDPQRMQDMPFIFGMDPAEVQIHDGKRISTVDGLHLRLADGRWLIAMSRLVAPGRGGGVVQDATAQTLPPDGLAAALGARPPRHRMGDADLERWFAVFVPAERDLLFRAYRAQDGALRSLEWPTDAALAALCLRRMGAIDTTPILAMLGTDGISPWDDDGRVQPIALLGSRWDEQEDDGTDYERWLSENRGKMRLRPAATGAALAVSRWFYALLHDRAIRAAAGLTPRQAADAAIAMQPEERRELIAPIVDGLIARDAVPTEAPAGADLAGRLQSWAPPPRPMGMMIEDADETEHITPEMLANLPAEQRVEFERMLLAAKAWKPGREDLPAIVALLDDPRPSRWLEDGIPRTLGDNALRAMATILRLDPRLLVGRSTAAPWTAAERSAAAADLRAWWRGLDGKPPEEGIAAAVSGLPPSAVVAVLRSTPEDARGPILDRIAAAWRAAPPARLPPRPLAQILSLADEHAGIAAVVAALAPDGELRPLLACWHDRHGRGDLLDALAAEAAAAVPADDEASMRLTTVLEQSIARPSTERLQRMLALLAGPLDDRRTWSALGAIANNVRGGGAAWLAVRDLDDQRARVGNLSDDGGDAVPPAQAIPLAVASLALADRRVLPEGLASFEINPDWASIALPGLRCWVHFADRRARRQQEQAGEPGPVRPPPTGLRVCDVAASLLADRLWQLGVHGQDRGGRIDLWKPAAERDQAIAALWAAIAARARLALAQARLPEVVPADAAQPAGGDQALF